MTESRVLDTIRHNCDISDARDNGIYSICNLVLKLRNLYKWEHAIEPWQDEIEGQGRCDAGVCGRQDKSAGFNNSH